MNRFLLFGFTLAITLVQWLPPAAAQENLRAALDDCITQYQAASAIIGGGTWREQLAIALKGMVAELQANGAKVSDTTLKAAEKGADLQQQFAALRELGDLSMKLEATKANKAGPAQKATSVHSVSTPAAATEVKQINQSAIKQKSAQ